MVKLRVAGQSYNILCVKRIFALPQCEYMGIISGRERYQRSYLFNFAYSVQSPAATTGHPGLADRGMWRG